jgi:hypothetical protein
MIMLPAAALEDLPPDQLKPVLLHELAHLRRRDLWVNWIQVILQSLYWFHPLVWLANLRLRREREMIVDDVVLSHLGGEREVYGNSLLSVVKQAARKRVLSPGYVGIAETHGSIASRLRRILDANRKLSVRLGWLSGGALIVLALLLIPQARPELEAPAKAEEPKAEETPIAGPQWKATLPGGVTVELVGVSSYPSDGKPWWPPDGSATAERPYDRWVGFGSVWGVEAEREKAYNRSFALRIGGLESIFGRAVVHRVEPAGISKGTTALQSGGKGLQDMYAIAAGLPEGAETCTIRFGLAGDWTTLMEHDGKAWTRHKTQEYGEVAIAQAEKADGGTRIAISHHIPDDQDARLVAEDNQGGIHASREEKLHPSPQIVVFDNLQPADIRCFRLEVRPFRWVEFRNVSLEPGHKTDVEVVVEPPWGEAVEGGSLEAAAAVNAESAPAADLSSQPAAKTEEPPSVDLDAIVRQIMLRQESVKTIDYSWTCHDFFAKDPLVHPGPEGLPLPTGEVEKDREIQQSFSLRLVMDGQKIRTDVTGQYWRREERGPVLSPYDWSWCFTEGKSVDYYAWNKSGEVLADARNRTNTHFEALMCAYRLFDPVLGLIHNRAGLSVSGRAEYDGHPCVVMQEVSPDGDVAISYYLAEDQGYCPVRRHVGRRNGELIRDIRMRYERDDNVGWRLASWTVEQHGTFVGADKPTIIINKPVDQKLFKLEFPPGTSVSDHTRKSEYTVGQNPPTEAELDAMARQQAAEREKREREWREKIESRLKVGDVAPLFEVKMLQGEPLKLADFRGKYVLLDFWATCAFRAARRCLT